MEAMHRSFEGVLAMAVYNTIDQAELPGLLQDNRLSPILGTDWENRVEDPDTNQNNWLPGDAKDDRFQFGGEGGIVLTLDDGSDLPIPAEEFNNGNWQNVRDQWRDAMYQQNLHNPAEVCRFVESTEAMGARNAEQCEESHMQFERACKQNSRGGACTWDTSVVKECADANPEQCLSQPEFALDPATGLPTSLECIGGHSWRRGQCAMSCNDVCVAAGDGYCTEQGSRGTSQISGSIPAASPSECISAQPPGTGICVEWDYDRWSGIKCAAEDVESGGVRTCTSNSDCSDEQFDAPGRGMMQREFCYGDGNPDWDQYGEEAALPSRGDYGSGDGWAVNHDERVQSAVCIEQAPDQGGASVAADAAACAAVVIDQTNLDDSRTACKDVGKVGEDSNSACNYHIINEPLSYRCPGASGGRWVSGCPEDTFCAQGSQVVGQCVADQECAEAGARYELCQGYQGDEECTYPSAEACGTPSTFGDPEVCGRWECREHDCSASDMQLMSFAGQMSRCDASLTPEQRVAAEFDTHCARDTASTCDDKCNTFCVCPDDGVSPCTPGPVLPCIVYVEMHDGLEIDMRDEDGNKIGETECVIEPSDAGDPIAHSIEEGDGDPCVQQCADMRQEWATRCGTPEVQAVLATSKEGKLGAYVQISAMSSQLCEGRIDALSYNLITIAIEMEGKCNSKQCCTGEDDERCSCDEATQTCVPNPEMMAMIEAEMRAGAGPDPLQACKDAAAAAGCVKDDDLACLDSDCDQDAMWAALGAEGETCAPIIPYLEAECTEPPCAHGDLAAMMDTAFSAANDEEQAAAMKAWTESLSAECTSCLFSDGEQDFGQALSSCVAEPADGVWCDAASVTAFVATGQCEVHDELEAKNACVTAALVAVSDSCKACSMLAQDRVGEVCLGEGVACASHADCSPGDEIPAGCEPCDGASGCGNRMDPASCGAGAGCTWYGMDGPGCPGDSMCMVYGCDACSSCTDDSMSVDGQCNSPALGGGQCDGMPDGGFAEQTLDDECEDYGGGNVIFDCNGGASEPPDLSTITECPSDACRRTIEGFGRRGCFSTEYQALGDQAARASTPHPWDAVGATDAFRAVYRVCTDGGDLDSAGPAAADVCGQDPGDTCGDLPFPDGPNAAADDWCTPECAGTLTPFIEQCWPSQLQMLADAGMGAMVTAPCNPECVCDEDENGNDVVVPEGCDFCAGDCGGSTASLGERIELAGQLCGGVEQTAGVCLGDFNSDGHVGVEVSPSTNENCTGLAQIMGQL
jgi:hypothetical protein